MPNPKARAQKLATPAVPPQRSVHTFSAHRERATGGQSSTGAAVDSKERRQERRRKELRQPLQRVLAKPSVSKGSAASRHSAERGIVDALQGARAPNKQSLLLPLELRRIEDGALELRGIDGAEERVGKSSHRETVAHNRVLATRSA